MKKRYIFFESKISMLMSWVCMLVVIFSLNGCKKFLDEKPDKTVSTPSTLEDCRGLLDNYSRMNSGYPGDGEAASDNYYLTSQTWANLGNLEDRDNYIWAPDGGHLTDQWYKPYQTIFISNQVLQVLDKLSLPNENTEYKEIKGSSLFFRGFALYTVASIFCKPYDINSSTQDPGVPVRLTPEIDIEYGRGTVQQTYDRIILDLKDAAQLLPVNTLIKSRPNKAGAFAALSRVYLAMRDYASAKVYADSCLYRYNILLNYPSLTTSVTFPFARFNDEVILAATIQRPAPLSQTNAKIPKSLYDSYNPNDLRRQAFFRANTGANAGTFAFKGSYDGSANLFCGLATDEIYLIRAECNARAGKTNEALKDLNDLLKTRWQVEKDADGNFIKDGNGNPISKYINYTANTADEALEIILKEREKELIFRTTRWTDLRRLNKESKYPITLKRTINGAEYFLPPNDLRYTMLIPRDVINTTKIPQNPR